MNKGKLAVFGGIITAVSFSFAVPARGADAETKKKREALRTEVKQDRKEIGQDKKKRFTRIARN